MRILNIKDYYYYQKHNTQPMDKGHWTNCACVVQVYLFSIPTMICDHISTEL